MPISDDERLALLEEAAWRRAVEGVERPIVYAGKIVRDDDGAPLIVRLYSDRLLELLLRAYRPERFGLPSRAMPEKPEEKDAESRLTDAERAERITRLLDGHGAGGTGPTAAGRTVAAAAGTPERSL